MNFKKEIRQLLKDELVIRHRAPGEHEGAEGGCCICARKISMLPGNLCVAVGNEGILCSSCVKTYAPEMAGALGGQLPETDESANEKEGVEPHRVLSTAEWIDIAQNISTLQSISTDLAKGIARGIVEAPAGHIGLLHYAKDIQKPQRKESESEKEYELRVRTHRMTKLYEIIHTETAGRVEKIKSYLLKLGLPSNLL